MNIQVAWGTGTAETALAAFDTALCEAGVGNYNLIELSSVIPEDGHVETVGTVRDAGQAGHGLTCVVSQQSIQCGDSGAAWLGWVQSESGRGLFYEEAGATEDAVRETLERGLNHARTVRDWTFTDQNEYKTIQLDTEAPHGCCVVIAAVGTTQNLID